MNSLAKSTRKSKLLVLNVTLILATVFVPARGSAQQLQRGISVQMAATNNALPMPAADDQDAWIVTVTADGSLYFGIDLVTRDGLVDKMIRTPRKRDQDLYIKADARAPYAVVENVLNAAHTAKFIAAVLLASQSPGSKSGMVAPRGFLLPFGPPAGWASTTVQVLPSKQELPTVKVADEQVPWSALQSKLSQVLQNTNDKAALVKADGRLTFEQVAHVIDVCSAAGFDVVLVLP